MQCPGGWGGAVVFADTQHAQDFRLQCHEEFSLILAGLRGKCFSTACLRHILSKQDLNGFKSSRMPFNLPH
eukprot:5555251-Amphidinium_carterae.5